jgi:peptidylprolyl isomerase
VKIIPLKISKDNPAANGKIIVAKEVPLGYNILKFIRRKMANKLIFLLIFGIFLNTGASAMNDQIVVLETNQGNIEIKLMPDIAPKACENFVKLAEKGYYNGLIFHRVIKDFMIQGGDPTGTGRGGSSVWGKPFADEFSPKAKFDSPGILAMANSGPGTNGSQFFITTVETPWLNMHHTIFGKVVSGYDVVQKIENCKTAPGDKPVTDQKIIKAYPKK